MRTVLVVVFLSVIAACGKNSSTVPAATALSPEGSRHTGLSWSPDGKRVTWWTPGGDTLFGGQLWIANADFSSPVKLPVIGFDIPVAWSADGKQITATATDKGFGQVVVVPSDPSAAGVARHVTPGRALQNHVMFHPHDDRLLYVEYAEGGVYTMSVVSLVTGKRTPLLPNEKRPYYGLWSPDGSHIAYVIQDGSKNTLWVADSSGLNPRQLTTEGFEAIGLALGNVWSPDGKEILYESRRTGKADLWVAPIDGSKPRQLTRDVRNDYSGTWSSDGKWIAFISERGRQVDVWVVPAAGGAEVRVTDGVAEERQTARWRPGTHELAFTSTTAAGGIWTFDLAQGKERRLTPDSIRTGNKEVSPDGKQIAFIIERGASIAELATMPVSGGPWRTIVPGKWVGPPTWSPDGSRIAFQSDLTATNDIWIVDSSGGAPRQVESFPGYEWSPTWSSDGSQLYFTADRDAKLGDVWKAPAAGGEPVRVTHDGSVSFAYSRPGVPGLFAATISRRAGEFSIARVTAGGRLETIWDKSNVFAGPISPKGDSMILNVQQPDGKFRPTMFSVNGGVGRPILKRLEYAASWSNDGTAVLYTFLSNGLNDIGLLNLADGSTRRLTTSPEDETGTPEFTADGKTVVFRRDNNLTRVYTTDLTKLLAGSK